MAHLIQFLLPVEDAAGGRVPADAFGRVKAELTDRFGGVTAFTQSPAEGWWAPESTAGADRGDRAERDRVAVFEVVADTLDAAWWRGYRQDLERRFAQEAVLMRAWPVQTL